MKKLTMSLSSSQAKLLSLESRRRFGLTNKLPMKRLATRRNRLMDRKMMVKLIE